MFGFVTRNNDFMFGFVTRNSDSMFGFVTSTHHKGQAKRQRGQRGGEETGVLHFLIVGILSLDEKALPLHQQLN